MGAERAVLAPLDCNVLRLKVHIFQFVSDYVGISVAEAEMCVSLGKNLCGNASKL
jgi:hypothetical protein